MRFGVFNVFSRSPISENPEAALHEGETTNQALHRGIADAMYAEALGYDEVWLAEGPLVGEVLVGARALTLATILAAKTSRIRIGTGITIMPLQHPLEVAIEAATIDQVSNGRFDFGIGRGLTARAGASGFEALSSGRFPAEPPDIRDQYTEAVACVAGLLSKPCFSFPGKYYEFNNCVLYPQPIQKPLPVWVVAQSPRTFEEMGQLGINILIPVPGYHGGIQTWDATKERLSAYRKSWKDAGHPGVPQVLVRVPTFLADTEAQAIETASRTIEVFRTRFGQNVRAGNAGRAFGEARAAGAFFGIGAEEINEERFPVELAIQRSTITGTAPYAVDQVARIIEELDADGIIFEPEIVTSSLREDRIRTMRILADKVLPKFK